VRDPIWQMVNFGLFRITQIWKKCYYYIYIYIFNCFILGIEN
jgi:hypothetical protein